MRHPLNFISSPRGATARLALVAALALPAGAIAAPDSDQAPAIEPPIGGEASAGIGAAIAGNGVGVGASELMPAGPFNPVVAKVDYGTAINTFGGGGMRTHEGHDMLAPEGTPLISPTATEVLETGSDSGRGNWAALYDPKAKRTYVYLHMRDPAEVKAGQKLEPGDRVGPLGCTGSCDGAHLHFEIREGEGPYGQPIDPLPIVQKWKPFKG